MSISTSELAGAAVFGVIALSIAWAIGAFRARSIIGPARLSDDVKLWPLLVIAGIGAMGWLGSQFGYTIVVAAKFMMSHDGVPFTADMLTGTDYAFLSTVPGIFGFAILLIGDLAMRRRMLDRLGMALSKIPAGVKYGLIGSAIVIPLMFCSSILLELIYKLLHFEHPGEHDLLRAMRGLGPVMKAALIIGATVIAPVFEEYFFRGHLQTILVRMFNGRTPAPPILPAEVMALGADGAAIALPYASPAVAQPVDSPRSTAMVWLAVIITSIIFAGVHAAWTAPLIFILSLCLGYAYERTGNLWTNIIIHATFNTVSTVVFLNYT